jgi:tRNA A-37 threonylcarbamoyl transferase component Bud32
MNREQFKIKKIIEENNLELVETEFFRQKKHVARVRDVNGNKFILKIGKIDPFQIQLLETAKSMETQLFFKVPAIIKQGDGWILMEEIEGKFLNEFYNEKPDWCVEASKKIADSYQLVIQEIQKTQFIGNLLEDGRQWLFSRLDAWSKPIVDAGLIEFSYIEKIKKELESIIAQKGEDFFGWVHGNIIGDHVIISGDDIYLIDLAAVPRIGRGYYDFLRALDFMFLKTENEAQMFELISEWTKQYLAEFDEGEVKLVFAFRSIGILGWDILHENVEYAAGNLETKKRLALKFMKMGY